jgi:DNA-binding beta-propeller fold protein YncE
VPGDGYRSWGVAVGDGSNTMPARICRPWAIAVRMRASAVTVALMVVATIPLASGPSRAQTGSRPIDVARLQAAGVAWIESSPSDIGAPADVFDRDPDTLLRSAAVNPAEVTVSFAGPVTFEGFRVLFSHASGDPAYRWRIDAANRLADLEARTGSFRELVPWTDTPSGVSSEGVVAAPTGVRIVRLTVERLTGDAFVHVNEWEMFGTDAFGLFQNPRGLSVDPDGRVLLAEAGAGRVDVFAPSGALMFRFGAPGSGDGQFRRPWDIDVRGRSRIYVVDRGNDRVQVFDPAGDFLFAFGGPGAAPGSLDDPQGIDVHAGRVYVADAGNHRVQRFLLDGTLDTAWANSGVLGITDAVRRDHTGFDGPSDVAVDPLTGDVVVADRGNQRLEVFAPDGAYRRTVLGVYLANALAFKANGDLLIAGEDPNDGYPAFDGRLRILVRGAALIEDNVTGGVDDFARIEGGVATRPDGGVLVSDVVRGRIVAFPSSFAPAISGLLVDARGSSLTVRWRTALASVGRVSIGSLPFEGETFSETTAGTAHRVTVTGLSPGTLRYLRVSFTDPFDGRTRFTDPEVIDTGVRPGRTPFLRLNAVGVIYTDTDPSDSFAPMSADELRVARSRFRRVASFYWRNSGFRLWLDIAIVEVDRNIVGSVDPHAEMEADLAARGFGSADDFDAAWGTSVLAPGNFGGGGRLFERFVARAAWTTQSDFVAIHEISHSIDSLYQYVGQPAYEFNHGIWAVLNGLGHDITVNGQILRNFRPASYTAVTPPFDDVLSAPDADNDGVPDASPPGVRRALTITEASLGSSTGSADTDGDGMSDFREATALPFHATDPARDDTDGDGRADGVDANPAYRMKDHVRKATPTINGSIASGEGWTALTAGWGFSNDGLVPDSDAFQTRVTTYAAWDGSALYLALKGPPSLTRVTVDGDANGRFLGADNYELEVSNSDASIAVRDNVGIPDLFRQIDNDGQFSEFFDTDPQFTLPYRGRPIFDRPGDGLGFPGRLVTEADLTYQLGGIGETSVWEVAIPWSDLTTFHGKPGSRMAIGIDVDGDRLFETDRDAIIMLVA